LTDLDPNAIDELLAERDELVRENALLRQENEELSELVQDYGTGLEATTELVRDHAVIASPSLTLLPPQ
jgi:regulator of replication initiation timing